MNVTLTPSTHTLPQNVTVQSGGFKLAAELNVPLMAVTEITMIAIPGPPGPPGPAQITVSATPPSNPDLYDLWVDLS